MTTLPSFEEFFLAAHGFPPFPWQKRLARQVLDDGWPDLLDLPTGAGKTSALDVAIYCLAAAPARMPRRTILVVDRRIVVDQGAEHARSLLAVMREASDGPLRVVADALRSLAWRSDERSIAANGEELPDPFAVATMRGGMPRDNDWAKRPDLPVLGVSTVDQVGSRLLFRGYGIGRKSASIHAGLIGNDTLILLDEVHLAVPFAQTLDAIRRRYRHQTAGLPDRFCVVQMSATVGRRNAQWKVFGLDADDRNDSVLAKRLGASKSARLVRVKVKGNEEGAKLEAVAREAVAQALLLQANAKVVAIVVNRVDTARMAFRILHARHATTTDARLVTGRMRAIDRDQFVRDVLERRIGPRKTRSEQDRPLVLVATQCIEAGADLDFDGLVTECASLDALRQRFGRLDRQGERGQSAGVILGRADAIAPDAADPVYGKALSKTWTWLESVAKADSVDFGIAHLPSPGTNEAQQQLIAESPDAPILLPAHLDAWAQTSHRLVPDPDVAQWLHDPKRSSADVQIVWRADLTLPEAPTEQVAALAAATEALSARRPSSLEAITVPIHAVRKWLRREAVPPIADVEGRVDAEDDPPRRRDESLPDRTVALRWSAESADTSSFIDINRLNELSPGDVLVVPCSRGGIFDGNFDPDAFDDAIDVADLASLRARGKVSLLMQPEALRVWCLPAEVAADSPVPGLVDDESAGETRQRIATWVGSWPSDRPAACPATDAEWAIIRKVERFRVQELGQALFANSGLVAPAAVEEALTEDDDSSFREREVTLETHSRDVRDFAEGFARALGFAEDVIGDLRLAGFCHDVGKSDPRFQRWLVGGSDVRAMALEAPLAKSSLPAGRYAERQLARDRAQYPAGYRHELLSVQMIEGNTNLLQRAADPELVLHLVASHHGWCRPFPPLLDHPDDLEVVLQHEDTRLVGRTRHRYARMDSGVAERFWMLVRKYGWWGLAWLEAVMRLADHRASEAEAKEVA